MSRPSSWLLGLLLVMAAGFLGYRTAAPARDPLLAPPEDVMIETLEWIVPDSQSSPASLLKEKSRPPILL